MLGEGIDNKKNSSPSGLLSLQEHSFLLVLLIVALCVTAHKLINATSGIYQLNLTCVEWVRCVGDFHLIHGIGFAVHLDGLLCRNGGPAQKHVVVRHILKRH